MRPLQIITDQVIQRRTNWTISITYYQLAIFMYICHKLFISPSQLINYEFFITNHPVSIVHHQLSIIHYPLFISNYPLVESSVCLE